MTDRKNFEALLDEYELALTAEDADDKIGAVRCVRARAAVLQAYDAAAGREGQPVAWLPSKPSLPFGLDWSHCRTQRTEYFDMPVYTHPAPKADK